MIYRFDDCMLDPAARQLTRGGALIDVPKRVFDCLQYLIEMRERAVGRDELIRQIWGRDNVSDNQLNQVVVAARRLIGSTSSRPPMIRTVQGFGYQWIGPIEVLACGGEPVTHDQVGDPGTEAAATGASAASDTGTASTEPDATSSTPPDHTPDRGRQVLLAGTIALALVVLLVIVLASPSPPRSEASEIGGASVDLLDDEGNDAASAPLWVLPAAVPDDPDLDWARIGLMALTGERLRRGGLVVVPLENVLMKVGTLAAPSDANGHNAAFGEGKVVTITARRLQQKWQVTIELLDDAGMLKRLSESDPDLMVAARQASEGLAIRLGAQPSPSVASIGERLDAIRQTINGGDITGARIQLAQLGEAQQQEVEARLLGIHLELRASRLEAARSALEHLLADSDVQDSILRGRILLTGIELARRESRADWAADVNLTVALLEPGDAPRELAAALMARGASAVIDDRLKQAGGDFQRARRLYLNAGDAIGAANALSNLGRLAILGARPREGIEQLKRAAETYRRFGAVDREFAALSSMIAAQAHLLLWHEAVATAERCRQLLPRIPDPAARELLLLRYAKALTETGRLTEARQVLDSLETDTGQAGPHAGDPVMVLRTHAALAAAAGDVERAVEWASSAFALGYSQLEQRARVSRASRESRDNALLLWMSSTIEKRRSGDSSPAWHLSPGQQAVLDAPDTVPAWIALGLWLDHSGQRDAAEAAFRSALQMAESERTLAYVRSASDAFIAFLIDTGRIPEANELLDLLHAQDDGGLEHDFQTALIALQVRHAEGNPDGWRQALQHAREIAGERPLPARLQVMSDAATLP